MKLRMDRPYCHVHSEKEKAYGVLSYAFSFSEIYSPFPLGRGQGDGEIASFG
jgi:hypothetical protein